MKASNLLLTVAAGTTLSSMVVSLALANVANPTDIQKQLGNTANIIAIAGTTALFGLLDDGDDDKTEGR